MDQHFEMNEGVVKIKDTGLYFVYAQVNFIAYLPLLENKHYIFFRYTTWMSTIKQVIVSTKTPRWFSSVQSHNILHLVQCVETPATLVGWISLELVIPSTLLTSPKENTRSSNQESPSSGLSSLVTLKIRYENIFFLLPVCQFSVCSLLVVLFVEVSFCMH